MKEQQLRIFAAAKVKRHNSGYRRHPFFEPKQVFCMPSTFCISSAVIFYDKPEQAASFGYADIYSYT